MSIHPQIIEREGKREFVVLPYNEFLFLQSTVQDYNDLKTLRSEKMKAGDDPTRSLDEILAEIDE